ncbi:SMP-30/gluconolactonase/LRE family protein [Devosia sp.]|uniref:SMP-30/gluconolactonase/LRE family protein n=1 Tax=Devosia sp. TaxID=1871048 RepID=UPI002AFFD09E|nr:SMP-30/gluconolactonase/LRE family protein [Devosia sp.]
MQLGTPYVVVPAGDRCGEAALWNDAERAVYWTDINRFLAHRYDPQTRATRSWSFDAPVVALSLTSDPGLLLVALGSGLILFSPRDGSRRAFGPPLDGFPRLRLNDGRTDPTGHFWVGSMRSNVGINGEPLPAGGTEGVLYRVDSGGRYTQFRDKIGVSNTLVWSPDRSTFYFADTLANIIWAHDFDEATATIGPPRAFFEGFSRGYPDGSTIDREGYVWNCRWGGGCSVRIAPDGRLDRVIDMPVTNPTTATFGGDDLKTLYITSGENGAPETERIAGSLFAIDTDVAGLPENRFAL